MKNTKTVKIAKQAFSALVLTSSVLFGASSFAYADTTEAPVGSIVDLERQVMQGLEREGLLQQRSEQSQNSKININLASFEQLVSLPGIGKVKASAIIRYRKEVGMFKTLEDLQNIKGIGVKLFGRLQDKIKL